MCCVVLVEVLCIRKLSIVAHRACDRTRAPHPAPGPGAARPPAAGAARDGGTDDADVMLTATALSLVAAVAATPSEHWYGKLQYGSYAVHSPINFTMYAYASRALS